MIKRTINKILKSISNLPAQYKSALSRILTGIVESINDIYEKIETLGGGSNINGDWNQNDSTQPDYIKNRTHYRESVTPTPVVDYSIQGVAVDGTIEDVLNYLNNNTYIGFINIDCGKYKYINNNNEVINSLRINLSTDAEIGESILNVSLYDNYTYIENLISFENISGVNQEKEYFLNIINLFCDNIDGVYKLKRSITINDINYILDESELEYLYHKLDKNYLPDTNIITKITYSELKSLRDNSQLIPGMQYRITDYQCTTTQIDTRSAGHQFDIIVVADDVNKLNENARACLHEGDTYFSTAGSKLECWKLKYCLDNDINKFEWANSVNGKGVIYWMKDEWGNECPYDFKNIQFKRYDIDPHWYDYLVSGDTLNDCRNTFSFDYNNGRYFRYQYYNSTIGDFYYTFQGFTSNDGLTIFKKFDLSVELYELNGVNNLGRNKSYCVNNVLKPCDSYIQAETNNRNSPDYTEKYSHQQRLNNVVFIGKLNYCYNDNGTWKYFISKIYNNVFGYNCRDCSIGDNCFNNVFGDGFIRNIVGNNIFDNIINYTTLNVISNNSCHNIITNCIDTFFGYSFQNNKCNLLKGCVFAKENRYNTLNSGIEIKFGESCWYNKIGINCEKINIKDSCYFNIFEDGCNNITFNKNYTRNNTIKNNNKFITLTSEQTTSSAMPLRNIIIAKGTHYEYNSNSIKTINHPTVGDSFQTIYKAIGSTEIEV